MSQRETMYGGIKVTDLEMSFSQYIRRVRWYSGIRMYGDTCPFREEIIRSQFSVL